MPAFSIPDVFRSNESARDNFLSRVFGMMSEEPVRIWCRDPGSPYSDLGRPTIKRPGEIRGQTVDFALRSKATGLIYVAELKCELAFERYKYMVLASSQQVNRHVRDGKEAFLRFINCARNPQEYIVSVAGKQVEIAGAILVWGSVSDAGRQAVTYDFGFADVISVEQVISELWRFQNSEYEAYMKQREMWCSEMFTKLLPVMPNATHPSATADAAP